MKNITRGKRKPPRVVLYGPAGVGKSTAGSDAPNPIFITTEDGVDNLPVDQFERAKSWKAVLDNTHQVAVEKHDYKTLVIDTLNAAVELCAQYICSELYGGQWTAKQGNGGFLAWGQGWRATSEELRKMLAILDDCRTGRGMTILLLAHTGLHNVKNPLEGDYTKFAPDVDKTIWARVSAWSDVVLRADYEYSVINDKGKGRAVGTTTRKMFSAGSAAEDAKCRVGYELPDVLPLSWSEFEKHLGSGVGTLKEVKKLWPLLSKEEAAEGMKWLGVSKLEDAPLVKLRQILDRLRQKQAEKTDDEKEEEEAA